MWVLGQTSLRLTPGPSAFELNLDKLCPFLGLRLLISRKATPLAGSQECMLRGVSLWRGAGKLQGLALAVGVTGRHEGRTNRPVGPRERTSQGQILLMLLNKKNLTPKSPFSQCTHRGQIKSRFKITNAKF